MRVLIITQGNSLVVEPLLRSRHIVVGAAEAAPREYRPTIKHKARRQIRAILGLFARRLSTLEQICRQRHIPYFWLSRDTMDKSVSWIKGIAPDIIVVFSMSQLLPRKVFELPPHGTINLHPSYLPEYRGPNPEFWQYYFQELSPGVTVHYVDAKEDTGDIIQQTRISVPLGIKSPDLVSKLIGDTGIPLLLKALDEIEAGIAVRMAQPTLSSTIRARILAPEEHRSIIDWGNWPIERIWHLLRGTYSWLNSLEPPTGFYRGQRWEVLDFEKREHMRDSPGTVSRDEQGYYVSCRDGVIRLQRKLSAVPLIRKLGSFLK